MDGNGWEKGPTMESRIGNDGCKGVGGMVSSGSTEMLDYIQQTKPDTRITNIYPTSSSMSDTDGEYETSSEGAKHSLQDINSMERNRAYEVHDVKEHLRNERIVSKTLSLPVIRREGEVEKSLIQTTESSDACKRKLQMIVTEMGSDVVSTRATITTTVVTTGEKSSSTLTSTTNFQTAYEATKIDSLYCLPRKQKPAMEEYHDADASSVKNNASSRKFAVNGGKLGTHSRKFSSDDLMTIGRNTNPSIKSLFMPASPRESTITDLTSSKGGYQRPFLSSQNDTLSKIEGEFAPLQYQLNEISGKFHAINLERYYNLDLNNVGTTSSTIGKFHDFVLPLRNVGKIDLYHQQVPHLHQNLLENRYWNCQNYNRYYATPFYNKYETKFDENVHRHHYHKMPYNENADFGRFENTPKMNGMHSMECRNCNSREECKKCNPCSALNPCSHAGEKVEIQRSSLSYHDSTIGKEEFSFLSDAQRDVKNCTSFSWGKRVSENHHDFEDFFSQETGVVYEKMKNLQMANPAKMFVSSNRKLVVPENPRFSANEDSEKIRIRGNLVSKETTGVTKKESFHCLTGNSIEERQRIGTRMYSPSPVAENIAEREIQNILFNGSESAMKNGELTNQLQNNARVESVGTKNTQKRVRTKDKSHRNLINFSTIDLKWKSKKFTSDENSVLDISTNTSISTNSLKENSNSLYAENAVFESHRKLLEPDTEDSTLGTNSSLFTTYSNLLNEAFIEEGTPDANFATKVSKMELNLDLERGDRDETGNPDTENHKKEGLFVKEVGKENEVRKEKEMCGQEGNEKMLKRILDDFYERAVNKRPSNRRKEVSVAGVECSDSFEKKAKRFVDESTQYECNFAENVGKPVNTITNPLDAIESNSLKTKVKEEEEEEEEEDNLSRKKMDINFEGNSIPSHTRDIPKRESSSKSKEICETNDGESKIGVVKQLENRSGHSDVKEIERKGVNKKEAVLNKFLELDEFSREISRVLDGNFDESLSLLDTSEPDSRDRMDEEPDKPSPKPESCEGVSNVQILLSDLFCGKKVLSHVDKGGNRFNESAVDKSWHPEDNGASNDVLYSTVTSHFLAEEKCSVLGKREVWNNSNDNNANKISYSFLSKSTSSIRQLKCGETEEELLLKNRATNVINRLETQKCYVETVKNRKHWNDCETLPISKLKSDNIKNGFKRLHGIRTSPEDFF